MAVNDEDVIQGVMNATGVNGQDIKNIFTWQVVKITLGAYSGAEIATIVALAIKEVFDTLVGRLTDAMTFDTVDVYKRQGIVWDYESTGLLDITPTLTAEVLPAGCAILATAKTFTNRVIGRKFIYGITENDVASGTLSAPGLADLADFASEYISDFGGGTQGPLDELQPGVYNTTLESFRPFSGVALVKDVISYQRRRKPGVGS